jgi:hypothetical protein
MAHRVDTTVDDVEPPAIDPVVDRPGAHSAVAQLPPRHQAMLARSKRRDDSVPGASVVFTPYIGVKSTFVGHAGDLGRSRVTAGLLV